MREICTLRSTWRGMEPSLRFGFVRHSKRKRGATDRLNLRSQASFLDPTIGQTAKDRRKRKKSKWPTIAWN